MTDHQLTIASFFISLVVAIVPAYLWLSRKLDLSSQKAMRQDLENIAQMGIQRYAEKRLQKMRLCLCLGAYLFTASNIVPRTHSWFADSIFPFLAALLFGAAGAYSKTTTVHGVRKMMQSHRKRLGVVEDDPSVRTVRRGRSATSGGD